LEASILAEHIRSPAFIFGILVAGLVAAEDSSRHNQPSIRIAASAAPLSGAQADAIVASADARRPRIGLVLGGGGAKGAAHIGVLQVLEELRVPVDCVAGTSMGALIGATFAAGRSPDEIERAVVGIDWSRTIGGQGRRDRMPISRKLAAGNYSNSLEFGFASGRLRAPAALIKTQDIEDELWSLVSNVQSVENFDDLPIPFRAVATDMVAGEMVVLKRGNLAIAMRASMALPGVFAPVQLDGKVLADGGMTRNLPVDVARNHCADIIIAVWMTSPPPKPEDVATALTVVDRSIEVMVNANQVAQIATLTAADIGIDVQVGDLDTGDFLRIVDAVELGRIAAESNRDRLLEYSLSEKDYRKWRESVGRASSEDYELADVQIVGNQRVSTGYIRSAMANVASGTKVSVDDIAADAERIFAVGDFQRVGYRLSGPVGRQVLVFETVEKSWGPDFLRFDFGLTANGESNLTSILRIEHDRTWLNSRGGRWHNTLQIGRKTLLATDFYQPLDIAQRFFVQPIALYEDNLEDIYLDGDRIARYRVRQIYTQVDVGMNIGTKAQFRVGLRFGEEQADLDTGLPGLPELDRQSDTSIQLNAVYDTRDAITLATGGTLLHARYVHSQSWFGSELDYKVVEAVFLKAFEFRGNSLSLIAGGAETLGGQLPITQQIQLGGIRTFPGLRSGELRGNGYWSVGSIYQWRLADLQPLLGQALYAGLRVQFGEMNERFDGIDEGVLVGVSGSISGRTAIGPFMLSLGYVDNGSLRLQFTLGRPVDEGSLLDAIH
jgi:NTE family protein